MAELALAIAPICLSAIAGINIARKKLKILRHHGKEIKRLRKKFTAQTDIFLDECQLLFQDFLDPNEAEAIIENPNHPRWSSPELSEQIRNHLGRKYAAFSETIDEVKDLIASLTNGLDAKTTENTSNGKIREAIDVTINKSKYESFIEGLKESNQEIKRLRKTVSKLQRCQIKTTPKRSRPLPQFYREVMQYSASFYDALRCFWSCIQAQHTSHDVRLLLDSRSDGSLRVIVRYHTRPGLQVQEEGLIDLLVRSQNLQLLHIAMPSTTITDPRTCSDNERRPSKIRRVMFLEDSSSSSAVSTIEAAPTSTPAPLKDLCSTEDLCSHLCHQSGATVCGGYLDTPDHLRHHVYPACNTECDHKMCFGKKAVKPSPLDKIFQLPVERSISVPEQVRIALRLVKGVLQFHSTPWLQPYWRLQDISYFSTDEGLAASLDTLHISTELSKQQQQQQKQQDIVMLENTNDMDTAQLACGIRNLTMHSLGVALLQVGQWSTINQDDVVEVRKIADLAERDSRLGPRYQAITRQCLDCDFGFGKDLSQPELQAAIYKDVVCELESLICTLEGKPQSIKTG